MSHSLLGVAVVLLLLWLALRIFLALSGLFLHLIWIAAVVLLVLWIVQRIRGGR